MRVYRLAVGFDGDIRTFSSHLPRANEDRDIFAPFRKRVERFLESVWHKLDVKSIPPEKVEKAKKVAEAAGNLKNLLDEWMK